MVSSTYFAASVGGFGMHIYNSNPALPCLGLRLLKACPELKATKVQRHMRVSKVYSKQAWLQPVAWLVPYTLQIHCWSEPRGFCINLLFWIAPLCWNSFSLVWVYSCASNLICKAAERHMPRTFAQRPSGDVLWASHWMRPLPWTSLLLCMCMGPQDELPLSLRLVASSFHIEYRYMLKYSWIR